MVAPTWSARLGIAVSRAFCHSWLVPELRKTIAVALMLACLSACSTGVAPTSSPSSTRTDAERLPLKPEHSPTETPTTDPTPTHFSSDEVLLFTITATATSLQGATVALRQQVFAPVEFGDISVDLQAEFTQVCGQWDPPTNYGYVRSVVDVTDTSLPGIAWATAITEPFTYSYIIAGSGWSAAYSGAAQGFSAACASAWMWPGRSEGTFAVLRTSGSDDVGGWARMQYGFSVYDDGYSSEIGYAPPTISNCEIVLEPAGYSSVVAQGWKPDVGEFDRCTFGETEPFRP